MAVDNIARGMAAKALENQGGGGGTGGGTGGNSLPEVTTADNGKFLRVVEGQWAASTVPNAEEASF